MKTLILCLLLGATGAQARTVVPNFTTGTVNSETTTRTSITEVINVVEYSTGSSYTVTGTNINIPANPGIGANYTQINPGEAFQFSETVLTPGIASETSIERTTVVDSFTTSISVFTQ